MSWNDSFSDDDSHDDYDSEFGDLHAHQRTAKNVNFPNNEIRGKIWAYNEMLKTAAVEQDATYKIELMQDTLMDPQSGAVFHLRLTRTEKVPQAMRLEDPRMAGAVQLICRFVLHMPRDTEVPHEFECIADYSIIHTMAATAALNDHAKYFRKKYASLLIHLMIFCVASARKSVAVNAVHEATARTFRLYDQYSKYNFARWQDQHFGIDIDTVDAQTVKDECRLINASRYETKRAITTTLSESVDDLRPLDDEDVEELKRFANQNIMECLEMMTKDSSVYLSARSNLYFI